MLTATARDASGNILTGRSWTWTANLSVVTGTYQANVLTALGVAPGVSAVTASSEGKSGSATVTVLSSAQLCSGTTALQLSVGQVVSLTAAQKTSLCLGGPVASEYLLVPFNSSAVATNTVPVEVTGTNTSAITAPAVASFRSAMAFKAFASGESAEGRFRARERRDLASIARSAPASRAGSRLTGIPATPTVGSTVRLNANLSGNSCTSPKQLHAATVVAVLPHTIVLSDSASPSGGYTDAEMVAFGTAFDTLGYGLDTLNFGAPTDVDGNGRVAIFFTPGVNLIPAPAGAFVAGLQAGRDLVSVSTCVASNEGEMFYMPVPDPNKILNANYSNKAYLANGVLGTLVHELQHLINQGRRMYVNNAPVIQEEVWLNEGLSHIAEELLYYRMSGNAPRMNISSALIGSSQAQVNAYNTFLSDGNFQKLGAYLSVTETNSPYSQVDGLETRGAIWQLLRYAADRKGGAERNTWRALVNSTASGQANFSAVLGDIIGVTRDWAIAQFTDDAGLGSASQYTHPSWNFRDIFPADNTFGNKWPLATATWSLPTGMKQHITLVGGGAAYIRFRVAAGTYGSVVSTSSGQAVPAVVDFILVRTQ